MTGMEASPTSPRPKQRPQRPRFRVPATPGGLAWMAVVLIVGVLVAVQFARQVYANWEIGQRADAIRAEIAAVEERNEELRSELDYLLSDAYVSAEARRLANLGLPGEQVLIIPAGAEEPLPEELATTREARPLLEQWAQLFFGARSERP